MKSKHFFSRETKNVHLSIEIQKLLGHYVLKKKKNVSLSWILQSLQSEIFAGVPVGASNTVGRPLGGPSWSKGGHGRGRS